MENNEIPELVPAMIRKGDTPLTHDEIGTFFAIILVVLIFAGFFGGIGYFAYQKGYDDANHVMTVTPPCTGNPYNQGECGDMNPTDNPPCGVLKYDEVSTYFINEGTTTCKYYYGPTLGDALKKAYDRCVVGNPCIFNIGPGDYTNEN